MPPTLNFKVFHSRNLENPYRQFTSVSAYFVLSNVRQKNLNSLKKQYQIVLQQAKQQQITTNGQLKSNQVIKNYNSIIVTSSKYCVLMFFGIHVSVSTEIQTLDLPPKDYHSLK